MGCGSSTGKTGGVTQSNIPVSTRPAEPPHIASHQPPPIEIPKPVPPAPAPKPYIPPAPAVPKREGYDLNPQRQAPPVTEERPERQSHQDRNEYYERSHDRQDRAKYDRPEKSPKKERKHRSSRHDKPSDSTHERRERKSKHERKERGSRHDRSVPSKGAGSTASLSLTAAQQTGGQVLDHRKTATTYQPPPAISSLTKPEPEPEEFVPPKSKERTKRSKKESRNKESSRERESRDKSSSPSKSKAEKSVTVADSPKRKKKDKREKRAEYKSVLSNKGMDMSDIPQPDSKSGMSFTELYRLKGVLGTGAFSTVREGVHKSDEDVTYAVKCVSRPKLSEEDEAALLDEVSILKEMNHTHIIRLYDFFTEPETYYLVMEQMSGGELFDRIVAKAYYNEKEARDTCKILLEAIGYCHNNHVAHRDLKPENLLLRSEDDDSAIKIADFGFAKKVKEPRSLTTQCGTPGYVAPEILEGVPYDTKSDMWSVGVILYILLGGYPPFIENNQRDLFRKIRRGEYEFHDEYWGSVSTGAKDLIASLLTVDPDVRLDARQALSNPWIRQDDKLLEQNDLGVNLEQLKVFNAKRKFRAAVSSVIAVNKLQSLGKDFLKSLQD